MKALKGFLLLTATFTVSAINAQSDSSAASQRALMFADSLVAAFRFNNLDVYTDLSYAGVIKYYGGKKNFNEYNVPAL
jgi:hypothetical protein